MFDAITTQLLRSAPALSGLDPDDIPQLLTLHYAQLVSARLAATTGAEGAAATDQWPLERIADAYELITSIHDDPSVRKASAFVAGTAQQILARKASELPAQAPIWNIDRDSVHPAVSAALLFLAAEQYADANEAALAIKPAVEGQPYEITILVEHVRDLARGNLTSIIERAGRWRTRRRLETGLEERALIALVDTLIAGVEHFSAQMLGTHSLDVIAGRFDSPRDAFVGVMQAAARSSDAYAADFGGDLLTMYAGPRHMASLLLAASDGMADAALAAIPPPQGADSAFWQKWIGFRATKCPFVWPNHRAAIEHGFHLPGKSAVIVLPTGAGKTTISSLKIAATLALGKKVVFLAPTHALVEQLTVDLQEMFPKDLVGSVVSSDFDLLMVSGSQLQEIEVMTPERCLAMLSFAPEAFSDVGLLVFDECHLLSPESGKIRRALDAMLCVLAFNHVAPTADMLFMSAMLKNGPEFGTWIEQLTGRNCCCVDLLWKPSRQARGVVIYKDEELQTARRNALAVHQELDRKQKRHAKALRSAAKAELKVQPFAIWGLQHNWLSKDGAYCSFSSILDTKVLLNGDNKYGPIYLTPNANAIAADLAVAAAKCRLKTIVFVNQKQHAVSAANSIAQAINATVVATESEQERWDALKEELGGLRYSILAGPSAAVPHNASMIRLERDLAERMFRRPDGAAVIVATPTLAQGLNLPAELAILAGDKRADADGGVRDELEAHEILNAAARAGRAGHLANGVVLLVPEPILSYSDGKPLDATVIQKLQSVLPEDDRCVTISDPLEVVLDRITQGQLGDADVRYTINRMTAIKSQEDTDNPSQLFNMNKSLAAYAATRNAKEAEFQRKLNALNKAIEGELQEDIEEDIAVLATQSGLSATLVLRLRERLKAQVGKLPITVQGWLDWILIWLGEDEAARIALLGDITSSVRGALGLKKEGNLDADLLAKLGPAIQGWISGKPLCEIEKELAGDPDAGSETARVCPRARELIGTVIPRGLSYVMSLVSHVTKTLEPFVEQGDLTPDVIECLGSAIRRGFDSPELLAFAASNAGVLSRVRLHAMWNEQLD